MKQPTLYKGTALYKVLFAQAAFSASHKLYILPNPKQAQMQIIISGLYTYASYINIVTLSFLVLC